MGRWIRALAFAALLLGVTGVVAAAEDASLESRAKEFLSAVSTGRPGEMERLVKESFGADMQKIPMPAHIGILSSFWDMTRGMDFVRLEPVGPDRGFLIVHNRLTGLENVIAMGVEPAPPHRISAVFAQGLIDVGQPIPLPPPEPPARARSDAQIARELSAHLDRLVSAEVFSGAVLLAKNGKIVFQHAYGQADKEAGVANRMDTRFALASMHKMITGVAVAQLVAKGKLSYEDPLSKFYPGAPAGSAATKIRIKHLVSNTSGLGFWFSPNNPADNDHNPPTSEDTLREVSQETLQFEPGTRYQYSNIGFMVLGPVIEQASGMTYGDYVREYIYKPAGMQNGDAPKKPSPASFAYGYLKSFDEHGKAQFTRQETPQPFSGPGNPAGGGYASAGDLLKFTEALRAGKLLSGPDTHLVMTPKPELSALTYGYGFDIENPPQDGVGHSGGSIGTSNNVEMFTRSGWTAIVLTNYTERTFEMSEPVVRKIRELLAQP